MAVDGGRQGFAPLGELSAEHEVIAELAGALERRLVAGEDGSVELAALQRVLGPHLHKEESGLFAELARRPEFSAYLGHLGADHASARSLVLRATRADPDAAPGLLAGLHELEEHMETEEFDFFPASRLILDDASWSAIADAHREADAEAPRPVSAL